MGKSELFSYLSAFVTIVLAIAMADMLQSTHRLLRSRRIVMWDARPLVFAAIVALSVISEFFSLWSKLDLGGVSFSRLLWLLATPSMFALLAYAVLPDEVPDQGIDLGKFYEEERRYWVALFSIAIMLDVARSAEQAISRGHGLWPLFAYMWTTLLFMSLGFGIILASRRRLWSWIGLAIITTATIRGLSEWNIAAQGSS